MSTPIEWLTAALVIITAIYAWQSHRMVVEMGEARRAQVRPKLVPAFEIAGPVVMFPRVVNIGPGSATEIECKLKLEPGGPEWRWRWAVLVSGEGQSFTPRGNHPDGTPFQPYVEQIKKHYTHLTLTASHLDVLENRHTSSGTAEIADTLNLAQSVGVHWSLDPIRKIEQHLEKGVEELNGVRKALESRGP